MKKVAFVGWRGMVGSVLIDRMRAEGDFTGFEPLFASTSQVGAPSPAVGIEAPPVVDAWDISSFKRADIVLSCQGSDYTREIYPKLRNAGWNGYFIDASSALRMDPESVIVLDPVNRKLIDESIAKGVKSFVGGNCTVSLMLMAFSGLFKNNLVEWMTTMTYQAASGAGAKAMRELAAQMAVIGKDVRDLLADPQSGALELDRQVLETINSVGFPTENIGAPLAGNVLPWIDAPMETGQSREEWKGQAETNKILGTADPIPVDGICVRIGAMRCHSQAMTIKLNRDAPLDEIEDMINQSSRWTRVIPNDKPATLNELSPARVTGRLEVPVGRIRKLNMGPEYLTAFTVGDQLLWGAAEPLRRMLRILLQKA